MIRARFFVAGIPAPQGSKKIMRGRPFEDAKGWREWRTAVEAEAFIARQRLSAPLAGALRLDCTFFFRRPKRPAHPYPPIDTDKLTRCLGDALQKGGLIVNDSQLSTLGSVRKRWTLDDGRTGAQVILVDDDLNWV